MATVLQRFKKLGLAYCNPVLQLAGEQVARRLGHYDPYHGTWPEKVLQIEDGRKLWVNNYPENKTHVIDEEILNWVFNATRHGRKRTQKERDWWNQYKKIHEHEIQL